MPVMNGFASNRPRFHFGAVAQLGERLICIQEVAGSIPTSSTSSSPPSQLRLESPIRAMSEAIGVLETIRFVSHRVCNSGGLAEGEPGKSPHL